MKKLLYLLTVLFLFTETCLAGNPTSMKRVDILQTPNRAAQSSDVVTIDIQAAMTSNHGWGWGYCFYYWAKTYGYDIVIIGADNSIYTEGADFSIDEINVSKSYIEDHGTTVRFTSFDARFYTQNGKKVLEADATGNNGQKYHLVLRGVGADSYDQAEDFNQSFSSISIEAVQNGYYQFSGQNGSGDFYSVTWNYWIMFAVGNSSCGKVPTGIYQVDDSEEAGTVVADEYSYGQYKLNYSTFYWVLTSGYAQVVNNGENYHIVVDGYNSLGYKFKLTIGSAGVTAYTFTLSSEGNGSADMVWHSSGCGDIEYGEGTHFLLPNSNVTLTATAETGYEFWRWSDESSSVETSAYGTSRDITVNSDMSIQAIFRQKSLTTHTVSIADTDNGTITVSYNDGATQSFTSGSRNITEGTVLTVTTTPSTGYHFANWTNDGAASVTANADKTIGATFAANTYYISFDAGEGGSGTMDNQTFTYGVAQTLTPNAFTGPEATITYDYHGATGGNSTPFVTVSKPFGIWEDNIVEELHDDEEEILNFTAADNATVKMTALWDPYQSVTLPTPEKTGYTFNGWYTEETGGIFNGIGGAGFIPTSDITLHAQWEAIEYTVTYYNNGGTGSINLVYNIEDTPIELPTADDMTKDGYNFGGWYDNEELTGDAVTVIAAGSTGNKEFWAKWETASAPEIDLYTNSKPKVNGTTVEGADAAAANAQLLEDYAGANEREVNVTLHRTFAANQWNTVCLPFGLEELGGTAFDGRLYEIASVKADNNGIEMQFSNINNDIEAGKPYLVSAGEAIDNPRFEEVTLETFTNDMTIMDNVVFHSTFSKTAKMYERKYIIITNNRLYYPSANGTSISAYRAYLEVTDYESTWWVQPRIRIEDTGEVMILDEAEDDGTQVSKYIENGILVIKRNGVKYDATGAMIK